ncbi:neprilysin-1-like [Dermacentor variabilis]|uniref:neprilysin-1-like n=1 Tax=Dermacentor variabilis TaxID=34621 RepID=UPI003F5CBA8C
MKGTKGSNYEPDSRMGSKRTGQSSKSEKGTTRSSGKESLTVAEENKVAILEAIEEALFSAAEPEPRPTSLPPAPPDRTNLVAIAVVVFVVVVGLLVVMMLLPGSKKRTGKVTTATCQSEHCEHIGKLLLDSVSPDVDPCDNFYQHVCGGWKYAGSQGDVLFQKLIDEITDLIRTMNVPPAGQLSFQKAALAYQACEDIVTKNNTNLTTLVRILKEAGLYSPPGWTGPVDALNATFFLHFRWRIAAPIKFTYVRPAPRGITLRMAPSDYLKSYARRRQEPGFYNGLKNDYEVFQTTFEPNMLPNLTYHAWQTIDQNVMAGLAEILKKLNSVNEFAGWNETTIQDAIHGVSRQQWTSILNTYLKRSDALRFYVDSVFLFKKFMELPNQIGATEAQAYFRWYIAEMLTRRVYAPWIFREFPTYQDALKYHSHFCFVIVQQTAGYALFASYVSKTFTADVKNDIRQLAKIIRGAYDHVFARSLGMHTNVDMLPSYTKGTGRLFDLLSLSGENYLEESYALYDDMTWDPLENWKRLMVGRSKSLWTRVSMGMARALPSDLLYYEIDGVSNDIILRPDVAVLPGYDSDAPLLLKLASLGSLMASAMAKVLYGTLETTARWHASADCIFSMQQRTNATESGGKIVILERVIALAVTLLAAVTGPKIDQPLTVPGVPNLSDMQLLFTVWCYQQCGEREGERLCNEPLKEVGLFAHAFQCEANTTMKREHACTVAWFKPLTQDSTTPKAAAEPDANVQTEHSKESGVATQQGDTM